VSVGESTDESAYTWLMKQCLTGLLRLDVEEPEVERTARILGRDWPRSAESMTGLLRLTDLEQCVRDIVRDGVPGDILEAGVWRGGSMILAKAVLDELGETERRVWLADSFAGLPPPNPAEFPEDHGDLSGIPALAVGTTQVLANFARYGLLDDRVRLIEGYFRDTLADAPVGPLAILRLDGDYYESTIQVLEALYDKVSPGGYVIVDDSALAPCQAAVADFRSARGITAEIHRIDWTGLRWRIPGREGSP
jgi:O-methyltransferase